VLTGPHLARYRAGDLPRLGAAQTPPDRAPADAYITREMVRSREVEPSNEYNHLPEGAGEKAPLTPTGNFQRLPHRSSVLSRRAAASALRIAARMSDADLDDERPVRQRKSKATKTEDDQGEALAEELTDDEWHDAG
jgi:hypothetical protein